MKEHKLKQENKKLAKTSRMQTKAKTTQVKVAEYKLKRVKYKLKQTEQNKLNEQNAAKTRIWVRTNKRKAERNRRMKSFTDQNSRYSG